MAPAIRADSTNVLIALIKKSYEDPTEIRETKARKEEIHIKTFREGNRVKMEIGYKSSGLEPDDAGSSIDGDGSEKTSPASIFHWCRQTVESNGGAITLTGKDAEKRTHVSIALPVID
jgi:sensor histidine kinase regulating citrate/malate metabolism